MLKDKELLASRVVLDSSSSSDHAGSGNSSSDDEDDKPISDCKEPLRKRGRKEILTPRIAAVLDRTKLSDRCATALLVSMGQSFGHDMSEYTVNRSSIRRSRIELRKLMADEIMSNFSPTVPLTVHWDGKLLPDVTGKDVVDRIPILVTGDGVQQLLGVPKLLSGTGKAMGAAVTDILQQWGLTENVIGMCFDTTASNTGKKNGACVMIEEKLQKDLLYFACRHHIFEIVLSGVFDASLGQSSGPDIRMFKRFQSKWSSLIPINNSDYRTALDDDYTSNAVVDFRDDIITFAKEQLHRQQPRDDYRELLEITIIFLGGTPPRGVHFMAPGRLHRARWMSKAIYSIKMWMLKKRFFLTKKEEKGLRDVAIFVSRFYVKMWFQATLPTRAPLNDLLLLQQLHKYKETNESIANVAIKKFSAHFWYLSEDLVALAFFDRTVTTDIKRRMVTALQEEGSQDNPKRATVDHNTIEDKSLEQFVSAHSLRFFNSMGIDCKFMESDPEEWIKNEEYILAEKRIRATKVVNDTAERGVALMDEYNRLHTCDEEQKQYLLQVVSDHRKQFPDFYKATLLF